MTDENNDDWTTNPQKMIQAVGETAFGHLWKRALAKELGIFPSYLTRLLNGERPITRTMIERLRKAVEAQQYEALERASLLIVIEEQVQNMLDTWPDTASGR